MTIEGILIIIVAVLILVKLLQNKKHINKQLVFNKNLPKLSVIETGVYFSISILLGLLISNYIFGLILVNALVWTSYHLLLKKYNYNILSWLTLVIFWMNFYTSTIHYKDVPQPEIWYYTVLLIEISLIALLIYDAFGRRLKFLSALIIGIIISLITLLPMINIAYHHTVNSNRSTDVMDTGQIYALFQTDLLEAYDFIRDYFNVEYIILTLVSLVLMLIAVYVQVFVKRKKISANVFYTLIVSLLLFINLNIWELPAFPKLILRSFEDYKTELEKFRKELKKRDLGTVEIPASKKEENELYVFVIGESLNKNHMSLYGYVRNTTPRLKRLYNDSLILRFDRAFSSHTHTVPVLSKALTEANLQNNKEYYTSASILNVLKSAGFETYWLSNQVRYGGWDNAITALSESADHHYFINSNIGTITNTQFHDGRLINKLEDIIEKGIEKNTVIFVHLMGNHGYYERRYPEDFKKYRSRLDKGVFGNNKFPEMSINHYDNSVFYNDYVVDKALKAFNSSDKAAAFMYFADHSEEVLRHLQHNSGNFTFSMTQIPMILSFSDQYKTRYQNKYRYLKHRTKSIYSTDLFYDLMVGLTGINTQHYDARYDLSNEDFKLEEKDCYTLDGKRKYTSSDNRYFVRANNIYLLDSLAQLNRVLAHRVNTTGNLAEVNFNGLGFETDLIFKEKEGKAFFEVGHDASAMSGMPVDSLLSNIENSSLPKIWFDIKNLSSDNLDAIAEDLLRLDQDFGIKSNTIIESGAKIPELSKLSELGFHTSYYLPTWLKDADKNQLQKEAEAIARQIKTQKIQAVSFDIALYPFVKIHLEKLIDKAIVYHAWDLSLRFEDFDLIDKLKQKEYYSDQRVRTILIQYHSDFGL
ncbi:MAG: phosphoethanolamine transferase [Chitinophagales bacterium]